MIVLIPKTQEIQACEPKLVQLYLNTHERACLKDGVRVWHENEHLRGKKKRQMAISYTPTINSVFSVDEFTLRTQVHKLGTIPTLDTKVSSVRIKCIEY